VRSRGLKGEKQRFKRKEKAGCTFSKKLFPAEECARSREKSAAEERKTSFPSLTAEGG